MNIPNDYQLPPTHPYPIAPLAPNKGQIVPQDEPNKAANQLTDRTDSLELLERELAEARAANQKSYKDFPCRMTSEQYLSDAKERDKLRAELAKTQREADEFHGWRDEAEDEVIQLRVKVAELEARAELDQSTAANNTHDDMARIAALRAKVDDLESALKITNRSSDEQMRYKREAEAKLETICDQILLIDTVPVKQWLEGSSNKIATLKATITALEAVLTDIADMPEYDQDDAHRLRHKARQALNNKEKTK